MTFGGEGKEVPGSQLPLAGLSCDQSATDRWGGTETATDMQFPSHFQLPPTHSPPLKHRFADSQNWHPTAARRIAPPIATHPRGSMETHTLSGCCGCGRNRYVVEIPAQHVQQAQIIYDNTSASRKLAQRLRLFVYKTLERLRYCDKAKLIANNRSPFSHSLHALATCPPTVVHVGHFRPAA